MALPGELENVAAHPWPGMVAVEWDMLDADPVVTGYQVRKDSDAWIDLTDQDFSHEFHGLTNGQQYTFMVHAVNAEGNGPDSTVVATPVAEADPTPGGTNPPRDAVGRYHGTRPRNVHRRWYTTTDEGKAPLPTP
jgi:hypothetical protein